MSVVQSEKQTISIAPSHRLQWEEAQDAFVLLYPEGMVTLNPSASEILKRCDGSRCAKQILEDLKSTFPEADLETEVTQFLELARERGWILTS